ncbi:uncharacterized protein B0J16DRAFT_402399 [Fusarium flagelliforme]|uniref:uncharacterized protein n=1 Tax=Fusarium flagelliforme TaxID=2675880 RepID=UPI001E8D6CEC|nr:uncharacterized protein B0J16DRAFT_402399 [Fusarium flagelliforme]KAH7179045.1 hypothetical protein B0J16DRAFT_402399 [Fusarium flagelliforme]
MNIAMSLLILAFMAMPVAAADDAEFAFNLLSDIAPILALFGDQFAKQFTSESLTWVDHLIFAMVPLGIITAITGALRVQGMPIAKAFIGRARENRAQAEIELMSSTSGEVCEIFNGNSIVRAMGNPEIAQFLIFPHQYEQCEDEWKRFDQMIDDNPPKHDPKAITCGIHSLRTAQEKGHVICTGTIKNTVVGVLGSSKPIFRVSRNSFEIGSQWAYENKPKDPEIAAKGTSKKSRALPPGADRAFRSAPNIQLNHTSDHFDKRLVIKHHEIFLAAITGIMIQIGLIVIAALVAFRVSPKSSDIFESKVYGFPCYAIGSLLLSLGTGLCSFIVERSTDEYSWIAVADDEPADESNSPRLLWLQKKQSVSDQSFNGYVIAAGPKKRIVTSSRNDKPERHRNRDSLVDPGSELFWEWLTTGAALAAALGFTSQFMGLRGLAFPCSIAQLGAIFVMTLIRATIRRRLGKPIEHCHAFQWYEIDFLAIKIVFNQGPRSSYWVSQRDGEGSDPKDCFTWSIVTADPREHFSRHFVHLARKLGAEITSNHTGGDFQEATVTNLPSPTSQHLLRVRKRLGDLSRWKTRSSPSALALTQSIELFMNEFFLGSSELKYLNWLIEARHSTETGDNDVIQIMIAPPQKSGGRFEVDLGILDAAMSLWMASIDAKRLKATDDTHKTGDSRYSKRAREWRRERNGDSLICDFYRIIGNNLEDNVLKRDISWWVDNLIAEGSEERGYERNRSGKWIRVKADSDIAIGFNGVKVNVETDDTGQQTELGVHSEAPLPTILAQHLLTSFMWTVAQHLPADCLQPTDDDAQNRVEVDRSRTFESYDFDQAWPKLKLNHQRLDKLIDKMESYGMGSRKEILLCIIPALSFHKLLPNQEILKLVPRMNHGSGWLEIAACHERLLETIKRGIMSIEDKLDVGIVIATVDFLFFACENYDEYNEPSPELNDKLRIVVHKLATARFTDIFERLSPVYSKQNRLNMLHDIFQRFGCPERIHRSPGEPLDERPLDDFYAMKTLGFTKYHLLASSSYPTYDMDSLNLLRDSPADDKDTIARDAFGWTPYHYSCIAGPPQYIYSHASLAGIAAQVCRLRCHYSRSPLDIACLEGRYFELDTILSNLTLEERKTAIQGCGIDGMTPIHLIARQGQLYCLNTIARDNYMLPLLQKKDFWGRQALHIASRFGHEEVAFKLRELGAPLNTLDELGKTSVDYYVESKKRAIGVSIPENDPSWTRQPDIQYLDAERSHSLLRFAMWNPDCRYRHGRTLLHIAIEVADESSIHKLLEDDFFLDAKDDDGRTPLHYAVLEGRTGISVPLIRGFDLTVDGQSRHFCSNTSLKDNRNITTLMLAAESGLQDVAETLLTVQGLGIIDEVDDDQKTALLHAEGLDMIKTLVEKKANTLKRDSYGRTRLHIAIDEGSEDIASFLIGLEKPTEVQENPFDDSGDTLLLAASRRGLSKMIPAVVSRWKDIVDVGDETNGQTSLSWACELGHTEVVEQLLDLGADINKTTPGWNNYTPLHICVQEGQFNILNTMVEKDLDKYPEHSQEEHGRLKLEEKDSSGWTALEYCIAAATRGKDRDKAIRSLLLHYRTSPAQRLRCLKKMALDCRLDDSEEWKSIILDGFTKIIQEGRAQNFLLWLVGKRDSIEVDGDVAFDTYALALLNPFGEALGSGELTVEDPHALIAALSNEEIRQIIESQTINEQGRDIDGWSCATYIERYDSCGTLGGLATQLRRILTPEQIDTRPKAIDWRCSLQENWNYFEIIACHSDDPTIQTDVSEFTVTEDSDEKFYNNMRTRYCIPASADHFYFETEIINISMSGEIAIGFCGFSCEDDELTDGYERYWGWSGNNGSLAIHEEEGDRDVYLSSYGKGDTVGVYLDIKTGQGFCTKNGEKFEMGEAFRESKDNFRLGKMYPYIGFGLDPEDVGLRFRVNFSGTGNYPFKYQVLQCSG